MIAFIGLGNVGDKYKETKHNAGFWVIDEMAKRNNVSFKPGNGDYVIAAKTNKFFLVKPTSGMNRSGSAVKQIIDSKKLLAEQICIIVDDVDLPLGKIRIKPKGGDGSHRGLENIIYTLGTDIFPRLRYGIGTDEQMRPAENYVLKPFKNEKEKSFSIETIKKAADALDSFIFNGLNKTMNIYNS
ncbi:MAG: aminoacyl-tRNA hydrolase [Candidatus Marinimicrobia bacterium]|nr:aminoacyl-tRNA hydrolase [Candidatus Neomarinimicrobiota bacterium]